MIRATRNAGDVFEINRLAVVNADNEFRNVVHVCEECANRHRDTPVAGHELTGIRMHSPSLVKTYDPPLRSLDGDEP